MAAILWTCKVRSLTLGAEPERHFEDCGPTTAMILLSASMRVLNAILIVPRCNILTIKTPTPDHVEFFPRDVIAFPLTPHIIPTLHRIELA